MMDMPVEGLIEGLIEGLVDSLMKGLIDGVNVKVRGRSQGGEGWCVEGGWRWGGREGVVA